MITNADKIKVTRHSERWRTIEAHVSGVLVYVDVIVRRGMLAVRVHPDGTEGRLIPVEHSLNTDGMDYVTIAEVEAGRDE
jgi:hypothetical protein